MKIQLTKTKTIEWNPPWSNNSVEISDVVGIELGSDNPDGCPAVRISKYKDVLSLDAVGFVNLPSSPMPMSWDELGNVGRWSLSSAFKADHAALAINSVDSVTRQTAAAPFLDDLAANPEGVATSKDGQRTAFRRMADEASVLQASIPEYQALWASRLLANSRHPAIISAQTAICATLSSLTAQPGFCEANDEIAVFVSRSSIFIAGFRKGVPLLYRECPGVAGTAAMRESVKNAFGIDDAMLDTVFANNGIIDTRPALEPLLTPVVSQIELSIDYLKNRLGSTIARIFVMGDFAGCNALKKILGERLALPIETPNVFDGLQLPTKSAQWKDRYCVGEMPPTFMTALGAALSVLEEAK